MRRAVGLVWIVCVLLLVFTLVVSWNYTSAQAPAAAGQVGRYQIAVTESAGPLRVLYLDTATGQLWSNVSLDSNRWYEVRPPQKK